MEPILWGFTLFHLFAGLASLAMAIRLWLPEERAHWRSRLALMAAELMYWVFPVVALASMKSAWDAFARADHLALPILLSPLAWLLFMGVVFALTDFLEDGVLGNARDP
jgi:hypothetical protein